MKIFQFYIGDMPEDIKRWTDGVALMAKTAGIDYELYTELPKGLELPEGSFTDGANIADYFRFKMLSENPDWVWFDADVEPLKWWTPIVKNQAYFEDLAGIGIIYMNEDIILAETLKDLIKEWETESTNGFRNIHIYSCGGFIRSYIRKNNLSSVIPAGFYNHHHSVSWLNPRRQKTIAKKEPLLEKIRLQKEINPDGYNHIQKLFQGGVNEATLRKTPYLAEISPLQSSAK